MSVDYTGLIADLRRAGIGLSNRKINAMRRNANQATVLYWHRKFLPGHFTQAQSRYRLQNRKQPYSEIKRKLASGETIRVGGKLLRDKVRRGGVIDIVRSGLTERQAVAASPVQAYPSRAILHLMVPQYAAMARKDKSQPDMRYEITRTTQDERTRMMIYWVRIFLQQVGQTRSRMRLKLA